MAHHDDRQPALSLHDSHSLALVEHMTLWIDRQMDRVWHMISSVPWMPQETIYRSRCINSPSTAFPSISQTPHPGIISLILLSIPFSPLHKPALPAYL